MKLPDPGPPSPDEALAIACGFLNRRERTVAEVRARLQRAKAGADTIDAVIAELAELGYLDDARYARVFAQDKRALEAWGNSRIERALRERGVDGDLIGAALAGPAEGGAGEGDGSAGEGDGSADQGEGGEPPGELRRAVAVLMQRFPGGPAEPRDRQRAFGVLARKGYASETAADAVNAWARQMAV